MKIYFRSISGLLVLLLVYACSSTEITRNPDGSLVAKHRTLFIKTVAPTLEVDKKGEGGYHASYGADGRGNDGLGDLKDIVEMGITGRAPRGEDEEQ
jgi:hypothetical protein